MDTRLNQAARLIESERAQIGHEIHDALLPLIFAASASVGSLIQRPRSGSNDDSPVDPHHEQLTQVAAWLDEAMQTGRRILSGVYPPELNSTGWTTAASDCIDRLLSDQGPTIRWKLDPELDELGPNQALAAYRIVIEAIRNAVRHGHAKNIQVQSASESDGWSIEVIDDGQGFNSQSIPHDRFGVRSMIGRAELVGGSLTVTSQPGGPTQVHLHLPHREP